MRLLCAELTKLRRPLMFWVAVAAVAASAAFAWQGARNASLSRVLPSPGQAAPTCADFSLPPGALCDQAVAVQARIDTYHRQQAAARPSSRHNARPTDALPVEQPLSAGKVALGFMASLPGALLILLLAAAHVGNEWNGRTIKTVLCQEGRRWRVLAAKAATVWLAACALLALDWLVLAALSPVLRAAYPLGGPGLSWSGAWSAVSADAARAPLTLAVFTVLGVAAAVLVRNALGAFALAGGFVVASLAAAGNFSAVAPWSLAWWVAGWMQFRSHGFVIYHFWVDGFPAGLHPPSVVSVLGLLAVLAASAGVAWAVFRRLDVTT